MELFVAAMNVAIIVLTVNVINTVGRPDFHNYGSFLSKREATSFVHVRKARSACSSEEGHCEGNPDECTTEPMREEQCRGKYCPAGQVCYMTTPCPVHFRWACKDNACTKLRPCKNGATCVIKENYYACLCASGWTGKHCDINIDECQSSPCQHGTCIDKVNNYTCNCEEDFNGRHCETDACSLQSSSGGELVFVIDSSVSKGNSTFQKQLQYMRDFVSKFPIAPTKFQVAIVTFSFRPEVKCFLNTHASLSAVVNEIDSLRYSGGPSYTGAALKVVKEQVLVKAKGMRSGVPRYVFILSDGLSSNIASTKVEANNLKDTGAEVVTIAIGGQINHQELLNISSTKNGKPLVFQPTTKDALFSVMKERMPLCPDCFHNSSDVVILFDMSDGIPPEEFYPAFESLKSLVEILPISQNKIHLQYIKYARDVVEVFDWTHPQTHDDVMPAIIGDVTRLKGPADLSKALDHVVKNGFSAAKGARSNARKMTIVFSQGNYNNTEATRRSATVLQGSGVMMAAIGVGFQANILNLFSLASDPALAFLVGEDLDISDKVFEALLGTLEFDVCEFD